MSNKEERPIPVIPVDYELLHMDETPFCFADGTCFCHEDREVIARVNQWVQGGLMTRNEATGFVAGKLV